MRHLFAAYDLAKDKLYGHIKKTKNRSKFLEFCRYLRTLYPPTVRLAIVCDNYSPHLTTKRCRRVADWGTDHASHKEQGSMIRRYIIWRNRHADDRRLRAVVDRANVA